MTPSILTAAQGEQQLEYVQCRLDRIPLHVGALNRKQLWMFAQQPLEVRAKALLEVLP